MNAKNLEEVVLPRWKLKAMFLFSFAIGGGSVYLAQLLYSLI